MEVPAVALMAARFNPSRYARKQTTFTLVIPNYLIGAYIFGAIASQLILILAFTLITGKLDLASLASPILLAENNRPMLYLLLGGSSLGTFLFPALLLQRIERFQYQYFPQRKAGLTAFLGLSFLFLMAFSPLMELISVWNMDMKLPGSMEGVETWMRTQEDAMGNLTKSLVMTDGFGNLMTNLLVMAVIPAIVEEFSFVAPYRTFAFGYSIISMPPSGSPRLSFRPSTYSSLASSPA